MAPSPTDPTTQLPLIPATVLRRHRVHEKFDTRFRACARLLQALWREHQGLPIGTFKPPSARPRRLGSLISDAAADEGRNFMGPEIAHLARKEVTYQERGALIDRDRLFGNLLSSMPLAFNLFGPLRLDFDLAEKVLRNLIPGIDLAKVISIWFEHSPGRDDPALTGDRTAFDVAVTYARSDGAKGFLGFEVKYSESFQEPPSAITACHDTVAVCSMMYLDPLSATLRVNPCQQLYREHLLAQAALLRGDWAEARFIVIAPRHNHLAQRAVSLYQAHLREPVEGQVPFINIELESFIEALGWAGELDYAYAMHDRYCDWQKLDGLVEEALSSREASWQILPPARRPALALIAQAA